MQKQGLTSQGISLGVTIFIAFSLLQNAVSNQVLSRLSQDVAADFTWIAAAETYIGYIFVVFVLINTVAFSRALYNHYIRKSATKTSFDVYFERIVSTVVFGAVIAGFIALMYLGITR